MSERKPNAQKRGREPDKEKSTDSKATSSRACPQCPMLERQIIALEAQMAEWFAESDRKHAESDRLHREHAASALKAQEESRAGGAELDGVKRELASLRATLTLGDWVGALDADLTRRILPGARSATRLCDIELMEDLTEEQRGKFQSFCAGAGRPPAAFDLGSLFARIRAKAAADIHLGRGKRLTRRDFSEFAVAQGLSDDDQSVLWRCHQLRQSERK